MQLTKIAGVALALLMVTGTAAAMPGAAPAQAEENTDANATEMDEDRNQSAEAADASDRGGAPDRADRGPPADLPSQVPDFVGDVHDTIGQFLDGDRDGSLGERLSDLTPDDEDADQSDGNESSTADATPTAQADA